MEKEPHHLPRSARPPRLRSVRLNRRPGLFLSAAPGRRPYRDDLLHGESGRAESVNDDDSLRGHNGDALAIIRTETPSGWKEEATDSKSARQLAEKHGPALIKRGADDFHKKYMKDLSEGFERVTDPSGNPTLIRRDRMEQALQNGYGNSPTAPRMTMPEVPWERQKITPGKHKYRFINGVMQEV